MATQVSTGPTKLTHVTISTPKVTKKDFNLKGLSIAHAENGVIVDLNYEAKKPPKNGDYEMKFPRKQHVFKDMGEASKFVASAMGGGLPDEDDDATES